MAEFFITFGVQYSRVPHPTFPLAHPDGWVVIEAPDEEAAREHAYARLGQRWAFIYTADTFDTSWHPLGELARFAAEAPSECDAGHDLTCPFCPGCCPCGLCAEAAAVEAETGDPDSGRWWS